INPETGESQLFYQSLDEFGKPFEVGNFSYFYDKSSLGKFKFTAECLKDPSTKKPVRIDIDPRGLRSQYEVNKAAMDEVYRRFPNFDWMPFDQRQNQPRYQKDCSIFEPDGKPDCIIFVVRSHLGMPVQVFKRRQSGWGGGIASSHLSSYKSPFEGIRFDNSGFTTSNESAKKPNTYQGLFLHEIAHKLYEAPHYCGANGEIGGYFFMQNAAYGMMNTGNRMNALANGWERWFLGWIDLDSNQSDQSIDYIADSTYSFELEDFATAGQAIRLPIPYYPDQYLWIENHQHPSPIERGDYQGKKLSKNGELVPEPEGGIYAYIEGISGSRYQLPRYGNDKQSNAFKLLHAGGNWDYSWTEPSKSWSNYYNNPVVIFKKEQENPLAGTNPFLSIPGDYPKKWKKGAESDGEFTYSSSIHGAKFEAITFLKQRNDTDTAMVYAQTGGRNAESIALGNRNAFFEIGDEISLSGIVSVAGLQGYNKQAGALDPLRLNGMQVRFEQVSPTKISVILRYNDLYLRKDKRWCGSANIYPNYFDNQRPALRVCKGVNLTLDRSGTINTHKKQENNSFIAESVFRLQPRAVLKLDSKSTLIIKNNTTLIIEAGAKLILEAKARITLESGGQLIIEEGAVVERHPKSRIDKN
ncbi:MAG: hypothetical protein ACPGEC_01730, partial [Flavobacteriales bacterium]